MTDGVAPKILPPPPGTRLSGIPTDWAIVKNLVDPGNPQWSASWERLIATYRPAMTTYVGWRLKASGAARVTQDDVEDVVQGFLAWAMESGTLAKADPLRGPFRAWLQILLKRYVYRHLRGRWRAESPGGKATVSVDEAADLADDEMPVVDRVSVAEDSQAFDRGWVERLVAVAIERLEERHPPYAAVIRDLIAASRSGAAAVPEEPEARVRTRGKAASETEGRARAPSKERHLRFHARKAFRECFESAIRETVASDADVAIEWTELARFLP